MPVRGGVPAFELPLERVHLTELDVVHRRVAVEPVRRALLVDERAELVILDQLTEQIPDAGLVELGGDDRLDEPVMRLDDVRSRRTLAVERIGVDIGAERLRYRVAEIRASS